MKRERERERHALLVLQEFVSIDGLVSGPNDSADFIPDSTEGDATFGRAVV